MFSHVHNGEQVSTIVLEKQSQSFQRLRHAWIMDSTTRAAIAANIKRLRARQKWTQDELATRAGVAQTLISYLEKPDSKSPTIETMEKVAAAFGIPAWTLMIDTDRLDPERMRSLDSVVHSYVNLPADGQASIHRVADMEVRYAKAS